MKLIAGTTDLARAAAATVLITGLALAAYAGGLVLGMSVLMATGAAVVVWMATAVLVWLAAPRFLGPILVALPIILVAALWTVIASFSNTAL